MKRILNWRMIALALGACLPATYLAAAQNLIASEYAKSEPSKFDAAGFGKIVIPLTSPKLAPSVKVGITGTIGPKIGIGAAFGTGFCLDAACRFIVTNYHVAVASPLRKIKGQKVVQRYLATGPDDKDATLNFEQGEVVPYAVNHDLALFELKRPLADHHGLKYSLDDLVEGQEVDIYGYPADSLNPFRRLVHIPARFKAPTTSGLLAFDYDLREQARGGMSGGIVVDRRTQRIVAVLSGRGSEGSLALGVPIRALLDFVSKVQPFVAVKTFPAFKNANPMAVDIYPEFEPQPDFNSKYEPKHSGALERRPQEPDDVKLLRQKAQQLADSMRNFIAVQSYSWGSGDKEPQANAQYEVRVVDGNQSYRMYPDGRKELRQVDFPRINDWALGTDEWAELPKMLGTEYRLKIHRAGDSEIDGRKVQIFQYRSEVEDNLCPFEPIDDYVLFSIGKIVAVACYGEAWTDTDGNILRISENLELSRKLKEYRGWDEFRTVLTYGPVKIGDEAPQLAPLTIFTEGENGKKLFWCRGTFSSYRMFGSHSRLVATKHEEAKPVIAAIGIP